MKRKAYKAYSSEFKREAIRLGDAKSRPDWISYPFEQSLEGRDFVAGKSFTMGDIPLGAFVYRWYALELKRPGLARVEAYYGRLRQRPAYRKHVVLPLS